MLPQLTAPQNRHRGLFALFAVLIMVAGLLSRVHSWSALAIFGKYPGDVLWAQMVYMLVAGCCPRASILRVALISAGLAYADEISQLDQAEWLNALRATTVGHLILGSRFSWLDGLSYTLGIGVCAGLETLRTNGQHR